MVVTTTTTTTTTTTYFKVVIESAANEVFDLPKTYTLPYKHHDSQ